MNLVMPTMLSWVLGGNLNVFKASDRKPLCHLCDKPKHFKEQVCLSFSHLRSLKAHPCSSISNRERQIQMSK